MIYGDAYHLKKKIYVRIKLIKPVYYFNLLFFYLQSGAGTIYYYVIGLAMIIAVFPCLTLSFKTKAPGAKTYPQVKKDFIICLLLN